MRMLLVLVVVAACSSKRHDDRAPAAVAPPEASIEAAPAADAGDAPPEPGPPRALLGSDLTKIAPLALESIAASPVSLATGAATGELGPRSADDLDRVILAHAGVLRACYQRELLRHPAIAGKLVVTFTIAADGHVDHAAIDRRRSTLTDEAVRACILHQVQNFQFPPSNAPAKVSYPFIFATS